MMEEIYMGNLGEVVTTCERSWVQASPWGFSFRSEKGVEFIPKAKVRVLHTAQLDVNEALPPDKRHCRPEESSTGLPPGASLCRPAEPRRENFGKAYPICVVVVGLGYSGVELSATLLERLEQLIVKVQPTQNGAKIQLLEADLVLWNGNQKQMKHSKLRIVVGNSSALRGHK
nr:alternative NAD(P)H-ubiquinone oxidoreductase C1, chloroplastic/mitochondrial [Tanacetum cinerariifolium]